MTQDPMNRADAMIATKPNNVRSRSCRNSRLSSESQGELVPPRLDAGDAVVAEVADRGSDGDIGPNDINGRRCLSPSRAS